MQETLYGMKEPTETTESKHWKEFTRNCEWNKKEDIRIEMGTFSVSSINPSHSFHSFYPILS